MAPDLPYNDDETGHSSGHSGSDTSKERAHRRDANGQTMRLQSRIGVMLHARKLRGMTVAEARKCFSDSHHGSISGSLTGLHKSGKIARLADTRGRCKIYVDLEYVDGRTTERPRINASDRRIRKLLKHLRRLENNGYERVSISTVHRILGGK